MKTFVIDASTCIKWVINDEENHKIAKIILNDYLDGKISLVAPNLWVYEIANGLKSAVLNKRISEFKGKELLNLLLISKPGLLSIEPTIQTCYEISCKYQISIYDSAYLTLAQDIGVSFITADMKLVSKLKALRKNAIIFLDEYE